MTTKMCPVCGLEQDQDMPDCTRCGWDFAPTLGAPEQVEALLRDRLEGAQANWRQQWFNPECTPKLEPYSFETPQKFAARLTDRPWYAGEGELQKARYDLTTGHFPLRIKSLQAWAERWPSDPGVHYTRLEPDAARALYQRSAIWPLYAYLSTRGMEVIFERLVLATSDGELLVERSAPEDPIGGRYQDVGDGTVIDSRTGLQWMRCALGQTWDGKTCVGNADKWTWDALPALVDAFNGQGGYGGHTDWRVPALDELETLFMDAGSGCSLEQTVFPGGSAHFWASSPEAYHSYYAWYISFEDGHVGYDAKDSSTPVRLVRGKQ